jgi:Homeodomain-like domain
MNHHRDRCSDNDFEDPAGWSRASYQSHPVDFLEPLSDEPNDYRAAAIYHLQFMYAVDEFVTAATDARLAVIAVAIVLGWPSTRGLTVPEIADQLGISTSTIARACARFREMAGLGVSAGGVRCIGNGAGPGGDKPAAVQA